MFITSWTDDRVSELTRLWADGQSCSQIAAALGGTTRNAVIGKIHRLGIGNDWREEKVKRPTQPKAQRKHTARLRIIRSNGHVTPVSYVSPLISCSEIEPRNILLVDLSPGDCRYPYGDGPFLFCGHPKREGSSFCPGHHELCMTKPEGTKRSMGIAA